MVLCYWSLGDLVLWILEPRMRWTMDWKTEMNLLLLILDPRGVADTPEGRMATPVMGT